MRLICIVHFCSPRQNRKGKVDLNPPRLNIGQGEPNFLSIISLVKKINEVVMRSDNKTVHIIANGVHY